MPVVGEIELDPKDWGSMAGMNLESRRWQVPVD